MRKTFTRRRSEPAYRRQPEQKRERLLASARELFSSQGFDETSTAEVAHHAGVSEGSLFNHFGSKRELFTRLAKDYGREFATATLSGDPADVTAESIVRATFEFAELDRGLYRLFAITGPKLDDHGGMLASKIVGSVIQANLERDMESGKIRRGNARVMADLQLAVVDGAYRAWCQSGGPSLRDDYIAEAVSSMEAMLDCRKRSD